MTRGDRNHRILLRARPRGCSAPENFGADTTAVPTPGPGQFLSRTLYLSLDELTDPAADAGTTVAAAAESGRCDERRDRGAGARVPRTRGYRPGEFVVVRNGWQQFALSSGQGVRRLDPARAPISTALGVLGMPGLAGYSGLIYVGEPRPGQTVLVSAATGAVGCTAGQAARLVGARAVGIAGSAEKCEYAVRELGYAECINYRDRGARRPDRTACPDGSMFISITSAATCWRPPCDFWRRTRASFCAG